MLHLSPWPSDKRSQEETSKEEWNGRVLTSGQIWQELGKERTPPRPFLSLPPFLFFSLPPLWHYRLLKMFCLWGDQWLFEYLMNMVKKKITLQKAGRKLGETQSNGCCYCISDLFVQLYKMRRGEKGHGREIWLLGSVDFAADICYTHSYTHTHTRTHTHWCLTTKWRAVKKCTLIVNALKSFHTQSVRQLVTPLDDSIVWEQKWTLC